MDRHSSAYIEVEMDNIMRTDPTKYAGLWNNGKHSLWKEFWKDGCLWNGVGLLLTPLVGTRKTIEMQNLGFLTFEV